MKVKAISVDPSGNFLVLLVDQEEKKVLPITIGRLDVQSILIAIEGVKTPRPMTHDLFQTAIGELGGKVEKIIISKIENDTYFAEIHIQQAEKDIMLDSRPSDAIALALRCDAPIYIKFPLVEFTYNLSDINLA